ncbi:MAG: hypothetical protein ACT4RN_18840 [Pseudonocardia sp.]
MTTETEIDRGHGAGAAAPGRRPAGRALLVALALAAVAGAFAAGLATGRVSAGSDPDQRREFAFEITGLPTANQGGNTLNLFFHYRYAAGTAEQDLADYRKVRDDAIGYLGTADLARDPFWETLNNGLCAQLATAHSLDAISCQLQVVGEPETGPGGFGHRSSVETIGDIEPLRVPGPPAAR